MTDQMFKPGYEGQRPSTVLTAPERQVLRLGKPELVRRLHDAVLTMSAMDGMGSLGIAARGVPEHIVEFGDRVGAEQEEAPKARFKPTAAQVSDMDKALALLEGLRPAYLKVVLFRALHEFAKECGERGDWPWESIGGYFGLSERWAEAAYDAAIVQAARRAGVLPMVARDYAVLAVAVWVEKGWLTNISTAADPRQATSNLRGKSPVKIDQAFAIWVAGPPVAKRVADETRRQMRNLASHGSWYKAHPDVVAERLIEAARTAGADWIIEDIPLKGAIAA